MGKENYNHLGRGRRPHSKNQEVSKRTRDGSSVFGGRDDAVKAAEREERVRRSQIEFEEEQGLEDEPEGLRLLGKRRQYQFNRALNNVFDRKATPQDFQYIDNFGGQPEEFITKRGNRVTITIVDLNTLPRNGSKTS